MRPDLKQYRTTVQVITSEGALDINAKTVLIQNTGNIPVLLNNAWTIYPNGGNVTFNLEEGKGIFFQQLTFNTVPSRTPDPSDIFKIEVLQIIEFGAGIGNWTPA